MVDSKMKKKKKKKKWIIPGLFVGFHTLTKFVQ